jgi:hypothetical protein
MVIYESRFQGPQVFASAGINCPVDREDISSTSYLLHIWSNICQSEA